MSFLVLFDGKLPFALGRLTLLERMGVGASATVFRATDAVRDDIVAVKILSDGRVPVASLKHEFRRAVGLTHPNIVFPLDLFEVDGFVCLTMSLVEGVDFLAAVRPKGELDVACLRSVLGDLATGVAALHAHDLVHGDLKPSNVIVTPAGRAVVVDLGHARRDRDVADGRLGAFVYAAPDVIDAGVGSQAGDWYSIGVMLFEALTGSRPFSPMVPVMYVEKQTPPRAPSGPPELIALCLALMHPDPKQRANGSDIFACLGLKPTPAALSEPPFIGRARELATILGAIERTQPGVPSMVHVTGPSGVGKSRLARRLQELLAPHPVYVLGGSCSPRDFMPLRAIDDCVEQLATHLAALAPGWSSVYNEAEQLACATLFPALMPARQRALVTLALPRERRAWAFTLLASAFAALAAQRPLVVVLDDLQWGDALSARALREVLAMPGMRITCVLVYRSDAAHYEQGFISDLLAWERAELVSKALHVPLGPLPDPDAAALAMALNLSPSAALEVARNADGMPFFIELLAQSPAGDATIVEALSRLLGPLESEALGLLSLVCLSPSALDQRALTTLSSLTSTRTETLLRGLEQRRVVRVTGRHLVEPYHDVLRTTVIAGLSDEQAAVLHRQLAAYACATVPPDHTDAAMHLRAAGDYAAALECAELGAHEAKLRLAFEEASKLYAFALECDQLAPSGRRRALLASASHAAAELGHSREAAELLMRSLDVPSEPPLALSEADWLRQRAGALFFQAGLLAEGLAATEELRHRLRIKLPRSELGTKLAFITAYLRTITTRHREPHAPKASLRTQVLFDLGCGLLEQNYARGSTVILQATHHALREGYAPIAAYGRLSLGMMRAYGGRAKDIAKAATLLVSARELALASGDARTIHYVEIAYATADFAQGHHTLAIERFDRVATAIAMSCPQAAWDRTSAEMLALYALEQQGKFGVLSERVEHMLRRAKVAGNLALHVESQIYSGLNQLVQDRPELVSSLLIEAITSCPRKSFSLHHWSALRIQAMHDLYQGAEPQHLEVFKARWKLAKRAGLQRVQVIRVALHSYSARLNLALAARGRAPLAASTIRGHIRALRREARPYAMARAATIEAGLAMLQGDPPRAIRALRDALAHHERADNPLERAVCMAKLAELEGSPRPLEAVSTLAAAKLVNERAWFDVVLPGLSAQRPPA